MPNIKSAKKRVLLSEARNARNKAERSALKTTLKKFDAAATAGGEDVEKVYRDTVSAIDKAAASGVIHKNNAARKKSALVKKLNKA